MKLNMFASALTIALFTISTSHAAMPPKPEKCPGATTFQNVAFDAAQKDNQGNWVAGVMSNKYDTKDTWTFVVAKIKATSESDAIAKATASLKTVKFIYGPLPNEEYNIWGCVYSTAAGYPAVSVTPAMGIAAGKLVK
jgi:hypothetical protein